MTTPMNDLSLSIPTTITTTPLSIAAPTSGIQSPTATAISGTQLTIATPTSGIQLPIGASITEISSSLKPEPTTTASTNVRLKSIEEAAPEKTKPGIISDKYKPMCNWTVKELKVLLEEIRKGNKNDLKLLQEKILSKSEQEIKDAFLFLNDTVANLTKEKPSVAKKQKVHEYKDNIDQWLDVMTGSYNVYALNNIVYSDAVLELSQKMAPVKNRDDVNFSSILVYLGKMLRGEILLPLNKKSRSVFNQVVRETILHSKAEMKYNSELMNHLKSLSLTTLSKMSEEGFLEIDELADLYTSDKYNPLKIPLDCLNGMNVLCSSSDDDDEEEEHDV